jgi:hypothetical protein
LLWCVMKEKYTLSRVSNKKCSEQEELRDGNYNGNEQRIVDLGKRV